MCYNIIRGNKKGGVFHEKNIGKTMDEIKKMRIIAWTDQFTNPKDLRIVGLFAE